MKKIVIIGTGAVAAELTSYIEDNNKYVDFQSQIDLLGYIDYDYNIENYWKKYNLQKPVLGDIDTYDFENGVEVLIGISDIKFRNEIINKLKIKGTIFFQFIHHSVIIPDNIELGEGNIIYPFCIIGPNTKIGNFNMITSYSFISHDCIIGDGNFFSTAGIAGRVSIGSNNFFGIRSTVIPHITIGNENLIQAGMIVDKPVKDQTTIFYRYKESIIAVPK
ncbi:acetyltransferase [Flavobacterium sp. 2]|uniref:acetyltransferase n=1 Tax=Flavobacterium sp. 2 TaxID=308053 RepID=UPI000C1872F8|nr:acetyltransferase [Flavobacterium sp. 2]PIF59329.1 sugar O-acyltransferase (sialic acid O-acetyltransferase NeuD family) [Flavobacterium sp. 2]